MVFQRDRMPRRDRFGLTGRHSTYDTELTDDRVVLQLTPGIFTARNARLESAFRDAHENLQSIPLADCRNSCGAQLQSDRSRGSSLEIGSIYDLQAGFGSACSSGNSR